MISKSSQKSIFRFSFCANIYTSTTSIIICKCHWSEEVKDLNDWMRIKYFDVYPWVFQAEGVSPLPVSAHLFSVRRLYLVRVITAHRFEPESSNFYQTCHFDSEFLKIRLVHMISCNGFEKLSSNLHQILGSSWMVLKTGHWPWLSWSFDHFDSNSRKPCSASFLYIDLGRPRGVTLSNMLWFNHLSRNFVNMRYSTLKDLIWCRSKL